MTEKFKSEDGFSLLEVIISIGIMSVLSIFILQIFTAGARANLRAHNVAMASNIASSALEELIASRDPNFFMSTDFISDTQVAFGLSAFFAVYEPMVFSAFDFSNGFRLYRYYDENWQPVSISEAYEDPSMPESDNIAFILRLYMTPYESYYEQEDFNIAGLFDVRVDILDFSRGEDAAPIVDFETFVYFPVRGEMYVP